MGPGLETNLLVAAVTLLVLGALTYALRAPLRRLARYLAAWWERDARADAAERLARKQAERELTDGVPDEPVASQETRPTAAETAETVRQRSAD
jgi:hypothetical protein